MDGSEGMVEVALPSGLLPGVVFLTDGSRALRLQKLEGTNQDPALQLRVARLTQGEPQGEGEGEPAGWPHLLHDGFHVGEADGSDSLRLQSCGDQSHGLMAGRSDRGEDGHIHSVVCHDPSHLRG